MKLSNATESKIAPEESASREVFVFPASFAQRRLWFLHQIDPRSTAYVMPAAYCVTGPLDSDVLKHSLIEIVKRHESLRTTFQLIDHEPMQLVAPFLTLPFEVIPVSGIGEAERRMRQEAQ